MDRCNIYFLQVSAGTGNQKAGLKIYRGAKTNARR